MLHLQSEAQAESESQNTGWVSYYFNMHANKAAWIGRVGICCPFWMLNSGLGHSGYIVAWIMFMIYMLS